MYETHWGLKESPFRGAMNPRYFFEGPAHGEALARLQFMVDNQRRLGLLLGPSGMGKSLLLEVFARRLRAVGRQAAVVPLLGMDAHELVWRLAYELGEDPDPNASISCCWRMLTDRMLVNRYQLVDTVLLFDDVDEASREVLTTLARLVQWEPEPDTRLTVVISAKEENTERLGRRLLELCELRVDLQPWDFEETAEFLKSTLAKAGREEPTFDVQAIQRLFEVSQGVPRKIRQIAEMSLLAAAGDELPHVDQETIENVHDELLVDSRLLTN